MNESVELLNYLLLAGFCDLLMAAILLHLVAAISNYHRQTCEKTNVALLPIAFIFGAIQLPVTPRLSLSLSHPLCDLIGCKFSEGGRAVFRHMWIRQLIDDGEKGTFQRIRRPLTSSIPLWAICWQLLRIISSKQQQQPAFPFN